MKTINDIEIYNRTTSKQSVHWILAVLNPLALATIIISFAIFANSIQAAENYTLFESGQVRPMAMSSNGKMLYAVNTPDNRLEIYDIKSNGLAHKASVLVGIEPVAVSVAPDVR